MNLKNKIKKIKTYIEKLKTSSFFNKSIAKIKKIVIPGFDGIPIYQVIQYFIRGMANSRLNQGSSAITYNFFMALFPFIFFLFTILAYLPYQEFIPAASQFIRDFLPEQSYVYVMDTLNGLMKKNGAMLTSSLIFVLFFSSQGLIATIQAFNQSSNQDRKEKRNWLTMRIVSLLIILSTFLLIILMIIGLIMLGKLSKHLEQIGFNSLWLIIAAKWIFVFFFIFLIISMIYYFAPTTRKGFHFFSIGSAFATVMVTLSSWGFNIYISNFSRYNAIFGSIGAIIILLFYIKFLSYFMIVGYELNLSIRTAKINGISILNVQEKRHEEQW